MFQGFGKSSAARGRAALTWDRERAALAHVSHRDQPMPRLHATLQLLGSDAGGSADLAALDLGDAGIPDLPLSAVLPDGSYQLLLEELPNAPREEMREALGWRIKDRIETPLEEAVIELLEMPPQARNADKPSAYAVVAKQDDVQSQITRIKTCGLKLDTIDLPELCMRNLAIRLPQDADGVAFLHFTEDSGLLTITRQGVLYLIRRIEIGQLQLEQTPQTQVQMGLIPQICLELQRSLDYYETHFDLPSISELVVGPGNGLETLKAALQEQLGLRVSTLDFASLFEMDEPLDPDTQKEVLFAVGASLRPDANSGWE